MSAEEVMFLLALVGKFVS